MPREKVKIIAESGRITSVPAELATVFVGGISRSLAIGTFCQAFRIGRRPEHWLEAKAAQFRALLNDPITDDEASALAMAVEGKVLTRDLLTWLRDPTISWNDFDARRQSEYASGQAKASEQLTRFWDEEWARATFAPTATACDSCGARPSELNWNWESTSIAAGWATYCCTCAKRVDFFVVLKGHPVSPF